MSKGAFVGATRAAVGKVTNEGQVLNEGKLGKLVHFEQYTFRVNLAPVGTFSNYSIILFLLH